MKIFLYVVALILIAFGAAISVMSWLAPGDVLVGVTPALGASLLVGGLLLLGLGVIVAGLQELNANILHLLYLVSEQQNAFAGSAEAIADMEEASPYEEPLAPAASSATATMSVAEPSGASQAPVTGETPSPGHMAAAAAVAAMAAQGTTRETTAKEQAAGIAAAETEIEHIPVVPVPETGEAVEGRPSTKPVPGTAEQPPEVEPAKAERSPAKPAATDGKGPEVETKKPAAAKPGAEKPSGPATTKETGRTEPEMRGVQEKKDGGKSAADKVEKKPTTVSATGAKGGKTSSAAAGSAGKPAEGSEESVKKDEPAAKSIKEKKEPVAPAMEKKKQEAAGKEAASAEKEQGADLDRGSAVERLTGTAAAAARGAAGKGQSAAEKIAARLEALKKESIFTEKKVGSAAAVPDGGEPPLEKVLQEVAEPASMEEGSEPAGEEDLLYVVEQRVIRGRPARILSDGTIEAEMDEGWLRFENREHLDEYLDALEAEK